MHLVAAFAALIVIGTVLLRLPVASPADDPVSTLDAFFTATSAVCVTGLITVDTATAYTRFGQIVILVLIQLGGLGVMSFGAVAGWLLHRRLSFASQATLQETFFVAGAIGNLRQAVFRIVLMTLVLEMGGAALLWVGLAGAEGPDRGFAAVFLAVSAFCNAGFSVYSDNAMTVADNQFVYAALVGLIILGGLGYAVVFEMTRRGWARIRGEPVDTVRWSLHARVVLGSSAALLVVGAAALILSGLGAEERSNSARLSGAFFQSVSARTAGFNTVDIGALPLPSLMLLVPLMFVGGAPGSCAGGIKTTTAVVWGARVFTRLRGGDHVSLGERRIPTDVVRRAGLVMALAWLWVLVGVLVLAFTESGKTGFRLEALIFEQVSAFATVGLSTGLTSELSIAGKLWIIASMFVGRLGPLTIAFAVLRQGRSRYQYPIERVMIG